MNWQSLIEENSLVALLPEEYAHFAKPVCEGLAVFLQGLPERHQTEIFTRQSSLASSADFAERLGTLAHSSPVLQKIGQVLARDQRLSPKLRRHLRQLESLPPTVPLETIQKTLDRELGPLARLGITLNPPAVAEASVGVVIPFLKDAPGEQHGVFKILKPGVEELLELELGLLRDVGAHLDERCEDLKLPQLDYQDSFQQVRDKLWNEIRLDDEQKNIKAAQSFYADEDRIQIPHLFDCCTPRVTAMQRVWGDKVTDHPFIKRNNQNRLAELIINAMIAKPIFAKQSRALFHSDPHAGNLFLTTEGRLAILDWSLVGCLEKQERIAIVQVLLGALALDDGRIITVLSEMAHGGSLDPPKLRLIVKKWLRNLRRGQFPGLFWLVGILDEAVRDAGLRLKPDLMLFRKSLYTLEGVVADVGGGTGTFDKVLCVELLKHLAREWPSRWFASPSSRDYSSRLSNFDLSMAILSYPTSVARFWMGHGSDMMDACRTNVNANN